MRRPWLYEPYLFACLWLPALSRLECCSFLCSFWQRGTRGEIRPSAECQQICMSKEYRCDDEHFPPVQIPTTRSNGESRLLFLLCASFTCLSIHSAILHIIGFGLRWYYTSLNGLSFCQCVFYHFYGGESNTADSLYLEMYSNNSQACFSPPFYLYAKQVGSRCECRRGAEKTRVWHFWLKCRLEIVVCLM